MFGASGKSTANVCFECRPLEPSFQLVSDSFPRRFRAAPMLVTSTPTISPPRRPPDRLFASAAERPGAIPDSPSELPSPSPSLPPPTEEISSSLVSGSTPKFPISGKTTFPPTPYTRPSDDGSPPSSASADAAVHTVHVSRSVQSVAYCALATKLQLASWS